MDESIIHLYNAQNAIAVLEQNNTANDRKTQYTVLKIELNNIKNKNVHLPLADYLKLLKNLEKDLSADSSGTVLFLTLNSLLACPISLNENVPIGSHRKILDIICTQIKNAGNEDITTYLKIMINCLEPDLYFYLVEMNPEMFAQMFKKCIADDNIEIKILVMNIFENLYLNNMISLIGVISLLNLTIKDLLKHAFPMIFGENDELRVHALNLISKLVPALIKSNYRTLAEWVNIKQHLSNRYYIVIRDFLTKGDEIWYKIWTLVVWLLSPEIHKSSNIMNKLLSVIEVGLKTPKQISNTWDCWKVLITIYSDASGPGKGIQTLKYIKLLSCPFKRQLKYNTAFDKMFDTWIHLFANIPKEQFDENCAMLVRPFLEFSFSIHNDTTNNDLKIKEIFSKIIIVFVQMLGHSCENEKCLNHSSVVKAIPDRIKGYLSSKKVFEMYWKEILQCSGDIIKNLMKLNPLEYRWSDIASCVWFTILKLTRTHLLNSDLMFDAHEEMLRILTLLVLMSQNNSQLGSVCLQSLLTKTSEDFLKNGNKEEQLFKLIDLMTLPVMVSCLENDSLVSIYKKSLNDLMRDGSLIKFAGNKVLNVIKNSSFSNPVPACTYSVYCEVTLNKVLDKDDFVEKNAEDLAQVILQFLIFPFENSQLIKLNKETIENLISLHGSCAKVLSKELLLKFNSDLVLKICSSNYKDNTNENNKYLFDIEHNLILSLIDKKEYDSENIVLILKLINQMTNLAKMIREEVHDQLINVTEKLISILEALNINVLIKFSQNFSGTFENILETKKCLGNEKFDSIIVTAIENYCKNLVHHNAKENEGKGFEKTVKSFSMIFKKFGINDKVLADLNNLVDSTDSATNTPVHTPTTSFVRSAFSSNSKNSPNGSTPKSKKCLEDDFIVVPKTPVRKPKYTEKQKEKMKERSADIPSLYNELSQQSQDTTSLDQKSQQNSIFTPSCQDAENVSILELSTSECEAKIPEKKNNVTNEDVPAKAFSPSNSIISQFFNKSKLDDITNKCTVEDQTPKPKIDSFVNGGDVVNVFKVDKSPDLISDSMNDSDKEKKSISKKQLDFVEEEGKKNLKKRSRDESDEKEDASEIKNDDVDRSFKKLRSTQKQKQNTSNREVKQENAKKMKSKEVDSNSPVERRKLKRELKRISMDIKESDKFVNLGNRRSKTTPQKFNGLLRNKRLRNKKVSNEARNSTKKTVNNSDQSATSKSDASDNIDEIESFEETKTKPKESGEEAKEEENVKEEELSPKKILDSPQDKLASEEKNTSPKNVKNDSQWVTATPRQKLDVLQTSTPNVQNDKAGEDSDDFRESVDMVASSQEDVSQSLFMTGLMGTSLNNSIKNRNNGECNKDEKNIESETNTNDKDEGSEALKTGETKESIPVIRLQDVSNNDIADSEQSIKVNVDGVKLEENVRVTLKPLESFETSNLNTSKIIASPEQEDVNERNTELLNNTLDISPIRVDGPVDVVLSASKDTLLIDQTHHASGAASALLSITNSPLSTHRSKLLTSSANKGPKSRSAHMLGLCNREVPIVDSNSALHSPITKHRELMFAKNLDSPNTVNMRSARLLKLSDKDLLTFKKEVPSPNASPSASILKRAAKRKLAEDIEVDYPPNKSKRVSFNDPIFTTKYLLKESVSSPQDLNSTTPCVRKQLIADEKFVMELNNDNMELFCKPIAVEDEFNTELIPDSEEIMGIEEQIEIEKTAITDTETQTQTELEDQVFDDDNKESIDVTETPTLKSKPIFPELVTCLDPVGDTLDSIFLKSKMETVQEFKKGLFTISDIARLTTSDIKKAPIRSPKINNLRRILREYAKSFKISEKENGIEENLTEVTETNSTNNIVVNDSELINTHNVNDSELVNTQVCELLDKDYKNSVQDRIISSKPVSCIEKISTAIENETIVHKTKAADKEVQTVENTFDFDKNKLRLYLQQCFNYQPLESYEIVQDVIKEMLQKNYK